MNKLLLLFLVILSSFQGAKAQGTSHAVADFSIKDHWYVQAGLDMSLQNPYGYDFSDVFPNGKSFGIDLALGRWFTPELGLRGRVNWENGISLFKNGHDNWLAPFNEPGTNMRRGGYLSVVGDVQLDVHNILYGYDAERRWNMQVFPRAGLVYNFGVKKGSPLLGIGIGNTYKVNDRISVYGDLAWQFVSSGFVGVVKNTGTGSNANSYMDISLGVQYNLGDTEVRKPETGDVAVCESFWDGWFLQAGLDMTLQNPYGKQFSQTFPKGKSFGLDGAVGKHFSPEIALRFRLNWENGCPLFKNNHLEWIATEDGKTNMESGGYVATYMDVLVNMTNIVSGYDADRKWNVLLFPRAGLGSNLATGSCSPMVGGGIGTTYRLNERLSIYADAAYQGITSEFFGGVSGTGMTVAAGSNGFLDCHVGVQYDL